MLAQCLLCFRRLYKNGSDVEFSTPICKAPPQEREQRECSSLARALRWKSLQPRETHASTQQARARKTCARACRRAFLAGSCTGYLACKASPQEWEQCECTSLVPALRRNSLQPRETRATSRQARARKTCTRACRRAFLVGPRTDYLAFLHLLQCQCGYLSYVNAGVGGRDVLQRLPTQTGHLHSLEQKGAPSCGRHGSSFLFRFFLHLLQGGYWQSRQRHVFLTFRLNASSNSVSFFFSPHPVHVTLPSSAARRSNR
jgi:hypothetical protein